MIEKSNRNGDIGFSANEQYNGMGMHPKFDTGSTIHLFDSKPENVRKWCVNIRKINEPKSIGGIHECNFDEALDVLRSANRDLILGNLSITVVLPGNANDLSAWALKDR